MSKNKVSLLKCILTEVENFNINEKDYLFALLCGGLTDDEAKELEIYKSKINDACKKNKDLQKQESKDYLSGLELSYLLGLPGEKP